MVVQVVETNFRFPGQYDKKTGLHQNWHRDYSPGLGRYVEADPFHIPEVPIFRIPSLIESPQEFGVYPWAVNAPYEVVVEQGVGGKLLFRHVLHPASQVFRRT